MDGEQLVTLLMEYNIGVRRMSHDLFELEELPVTNFGTAKLKFHYYYSTDRLGATIESEYLGRGLLYVEIQAEGYATKYPSCKI